MYIIEHCFDVDGGFGDAVPVRTTIGCVETEEEANAYIEKWSNPEIYDKPYADLEHKRLEAKEIKPLDINKDPFGKGSPWGDYNYHYDDFVNPYENEEEE